MTVRCFKCDGPVKPAANGADAWECPQGVHFEGGWNFGSSLYDAMVDGVSVELVICDPCLKEARGTPRLREVKDALGGLKK